MSAKEAARFAIPPPQEEASLAMRGSACVIVVYTNDISLLGKPFVLEGGPLRIGRASENEIVVKSDSASRHHAHFEQREDGWWIVDDGSMNGTYLNDSRVSPARRMMSGDRIKVGATVFEYRNDVDLESQYLEAIYRQNVRFAPTPR